MTIFNMTALIPMAPQAVQALKDYEKGKYSDQKVKIDHWYFSFNCSSILLYFFWTRLKGRDLSGQLRFAFQERLI